MTKTAVFAAANLAAAAVCAVTLALSACSPLPSLAIVALGVALAVTLVTGLGNLQLWKRWGW